MAKIIFMDTDDWFIDLFFHSMAFLLNGFSCLLIILSDIMIKMCDFISTWWSDLVLLLVLCGVYINMLHSHLCLLMTQTVHVGLGYILILLRLLYIVCTFYSLKHLLDLVRVSRHSSHLTWLDITSHCSEWTTLNCHGGSAVVYRAFLKSSITNCWAAFDMSMERWIL